MFRKATKAVMFHWDHTLAVNRTIDLHPGAADLLENLQKKNIHLTIIAGRKNLDPTEVISFELNQHFQFEPQNILWAEAKEYEQCLTIAAKKAAVVKNFLKQQKLAAKELLYVDVHEESVIAIKALGCQTILVPELQLYSSSEAIYAGIDARVKSRKSPITLQIQNEKDEPLISYDERSPSEIVEKSGWCCFRR